MTCPAENTWLRYLGGDLEARSAHEIEDHLDHCASCRFLFADLARGDGSIATATVPDRGGPIDLSTAAALPRGTVVGRYVIVGRLGRGGMGVVYKAFDPELDRPIALKLVGGLASEPEESRSRLLREAKTLAKLSHPNVVTVHDVRTYEDDLFVAMEFVAGSTLRAWLRERSRRPRDILAVFLAAGAGLAAAHRLGIVHRDFKPENVMVDDEGRVRVLDFGLARSLAHSGARPSLTSIITPSTSTTAATATALETAAQLTRDGMIIGTPAYMAPEQDLGHEIDARSDQFSFCAALYEALFGQRAFAGERYAEIAEHRLAGEVRPPPSVAGVTGKVRRALLKGLRVDPAERHRSMEALLVELGAGRWTSRTRLAVAALAVTTMAAGGAAIWLASNAPPSVEDTCALAADDVNRVWNSTRRAELLRSFLAAGLPDPRGMADRTAAHVDRWTAAWSARRIELCKQAMRTDRGEAEQAAEQLQCLRRRLTHLDGIVSLFTHAASPEVARNADQIAADVPLPSSCDSHAPPVVTAETRNRWQPIIQGFVAARVALAAGRLAEAEPLAVSSVEDARKLGEQGPLAAALMVLGQVQAASGELATARATLLDAVRAGTAAREEDLVVESWVEIAGLAFRGLTDGVEQAMFSAEVAAQRLRPEDPLHAKVWFAVGSVYAMQGDFAAAGPRLQRAIEHWTKLDPAKHRLDIAGVENTLGLIHGARGEWKDAQRTLEHALAAWEGIGRLHPNIGITLGALAKVADMQRDYAKAEPLYRRALSVIEDVGSEGRGTLAEAAFDLAYFHVRTGRCTEARPLLARARERFTEVHGRDSAYVALTQLGDALCELARGRANQAITILERAKPIADQDPRTLYQIAATDFALARALTMLGKDRRRALELAERAREYYGRHAGLRADQAEVEAWLAAQR